jgi:hypothetical protein
MTSHLLRRRGAPLATVAALIAAGIPALLAPAEAGAPPRPPRASAPPDRVAYVHRSTTTESTVPQRTGAV